MGPAAATRLLLLLIAVVAGGAVARPAWAQSLARPARPGPALVVGAGSSFSGLGLQAAYFLTLGRSRFTLSPSLSVGFVSGMYREDYVVDAGANRMINAGTSLTASYGYRHRVAADLGLSRLGHAPLFVQGVVVDKITLFGPSVQVGYEFVGTSGFMFRFFPFGLGYVVSELVPASERWTPTLSIGLGWKLW